jgi:hypothetical protein
VNYGSPAAANIVYVAALAGPLDRGKTVYEKYRDAGFATPSGKIEISSTATPAIGEPPLPEFRAPFC